MVTLSKMSHHLIAVHQCGPDRSTEDTPTISYAVQWRSPCPRRPASSSLPTSVVPGVMQWQSPCPRRPVSSSLPTSVVATGPQKTRRSPCPRRPCPARQLIPAHQCGSRCDAEAVTVSKTSCQLIPVHQCGSDRSTEDTPTVSYAVQWRSPCPRGPCQDVSVLPVSSSLPTSVVPGVMQWRSPCPRRPVSSSLSTSVVPTGSQKTRQSPCPRRPVSSFLPTSVAPTGPQKTRRSPCPSRPVTSSLSAGRSGRHVHHQQLRGAPRHREQPVSGIDQLLAEAFVGVAPAAAQPNNDPPFQPHHRGACTSQSRGSPATGPPAPPPSPSPSGRAPDSSPRARAPESPRHGGRAPKPLAGDVTLPSSSVTSSCSSQLLVKTKTSL